MEDIKFKKATLSDWKLVRKLERGSKSPFFQPCIGEDGYKKYIAESNVYFLIKNGEALGTASYKIDRHKNILINGLTVLPKYRGGGIATNAMAKMLARLKGKDLTLVVHPENIPALLVYLRLGFVITGWKDNYFGNGQPRLHLKKSRKKKKL